MEKRQSIQVALASLLILAAGLWWFTQTAEETPATPSPAAQQAASTPSAASAPLPTTAATPVPVIAAATGPESDAVALSEEAVDKVLAEKNELASRASELEAQVSDSQALIALKEKQIRDLEAQLKQTATQNQAGKNRQ